MRCKSSYVACKCINLTLVATGGSSLNTQLVRNKLGEVYLL